MDKKDATMMLLHTLTPTHAGSGTQLSYVDLPIQRESHTGFPKLEASALKGCIRCAVADKYKSGVKPEESENASAELELIFGKSDNGDFASAVSFTDARLLFFPVKSAIGIFAWVTCPYVLRRFFEDCSIVSKVWNCGDGAFNFSDNEAKAFCSSTNMCSLKSSCPSAGSGQQKNGDAAVRAGGYRIMLEDYTYKLGESKWFKTMLGLLHKNFGNMTDDGAYFDSHALLISDDDFCQFVKYSTEVSTRIKINADSGTVDGNALFTEEFLPPESILYSIIIFSGSHQSQKEQKTDGGGTKLSSEQVRQTFNKLFNMEIFQIGSDSTLGKGLVKRRFMEVS